MEDFITLLEDVRDDIDFVNATALIDDKVLSSFDIIQIIAAIDDEYDIAIPATEIIPANFNSAKAMYELVERLRTGN